MRKIKPMRRSLLFFLPFLLLQCRRQHVETIAVKGSDTELNLVLQLAEAYMEIEPGVSVSITGGGSGVGIAALINGKTDIANSSREINKYEIGMAGNRHIHPESFVFAADALAVIVHPSIQLDSLHLSDLGKIYAGDITDWAQTGAGAGRISLYGRQSNSGTFIYFREKVLHRDFSPDLKQMNGTAQILEAVRNDPGAIGYVGLGYLTDLHGTLREGIRIIRLSDGHGGPAVSPLEKSAVQKGLYPLTRPLYQYTDGFPEGKLREFMEFEKTTAAESIIEKNGYLLPRDAGLAASIR